MWPESWLLAYCEQRSFIEFFNVNIRRNKNTRAAYGRAAAAFLAWCQGRGIGSLAAVPARSRCRLHRRS